ncbi:MAG: hypothetical protein JWM19_7435 [Actinomycetia bacterium]|nr:hypothetical protein [Actinomycetes bacterium]
MELSGSQRNLAQPPLSALLEVAKAGQLGGLAGEPCLLGLSESFGMEIAGEYFGRKHE